MTSNELASSSALERLHAALEVEKGSAYLLAPDLSIGYVNEGWRRFARQNGAPELASSWPQIGAVSRYVVPQLREMFETIYLRALEQRTACSHVYECSSKLVYRKFKVNVQCMPGWHGLTVVHSLVAEAAFSRSSAGHDDRFALFTDARGLIVSCSACGRLRRADDSSWEGVPCLLTPEIENVSHGLCAVCDLHYYGDFDNPV